MVSRVLAGVIVAAFWAAAMEAGSSEIPSLALADSLLLPETAPCPRGQQLPITGLSGVTWLGDDRYAAIMDNSDRLLSFQLDLGPDGRPQAVRNLRFVILGRQLDYEDLAPCPARLRERVAGRQHARGEPVPQECILVCEETTPAVRVIDLDSGKLLGQVPIPANLAAPRPNRGLEALATSPDGLHVWTANEESMPADGPPPTDATGTVVRLTRITMPRADASDHSPPIQIAYAVDRPHGFLRVAAGASFSGVVAIGAIDTTRLLVLERSGTLGPPPFESRVYLVDTSRANDVSHVDEKLADRADLVAAKTLLWKESLGCNLEGLCLGPRLLGGGRAVVCVADNGGLGTPTQLVVLVLHDAPP